MIRGKHSFGSVLALSVVTVILCTLAWAQVPEGTTEYELPGDAVFPEGIAVDETASVFYVSGAGSGGIYRVDMASGEATELLPAGSRGQFMTIGMDLDDMGRLWVAGGGSGEVLVFDTASGEQVATFTTPQGPALFLNDVVVTNAGDAYITDSNRPTLWRVPAGSVESGGGEAEPWLDFTGTAFEYGEGFNANGIVSNEDGSVLLVVQASTGNIYRVDIASGEVAQVDVGVAVTGGDGMVVDGDTLYVVQNGEDRVAVLQLAEDWTSGELVGYLEDERLSSSATAALVGDDLLVVNSQFAAMQGTPELPFTVSVVPTEPVGGGQ